MQKNGKGSRYQGEGIHSSGLSINVIMICESLWIFTLYCFQIFLRVQLISYFCPKLPQKGNQGYLYKFLVVHNFSFLGFCVFVVKYKARQMSFLEVATPGKTPFFFTEETAFFVRQHESKLCMFKDVAVRISRRLYIICTFICPLHEILQCILIGNHSYSEKILCKIWTPVMLPLALARYWV
jgi:hypothetical protein